MKHNRQIAKEALKHSTLDEFNYLVKQARLSERQLYIINKKLGPKKRFNYQIAMEIDVSPETVRDDLSDIYDRVSRIITGGINKWQQQQM